MSQRTLLFLAAIVSAVIVLVCMYAYQTDARYHAVKVVHFDDVHRVVAQVEVPSPHYLLDTSQVIIGDGFTIRNTSPFALHSVNVTCAVDGKPQEFTWTAETLTSLPPHSAVRPGIISYQPDKGTSELLNAESINYLLDHHKVTACRVTTAGLSE